MAFSASPSGFGLNHYQSSSWALSRAAVDPHFLVADAGDLKPTVSATLARTITVAAGEALVCGVWGVNGTAENISFAANNTGQNRYDALTAQWDWGTNTVAFRAITGTTAPPAIVRGGTADPAKINWSPNGVYDAVIGIIRVGPSVTTFGAADLTDCRVWGGGAGPLYTNASSFWDMIDLPAGGMLNVPSGSSRKVIHKPGTQWVEVGWPIFVQTTQPANAPEGALWFKV